MLNLRFEFRDLSPLHATLTNCPGTHRTASESSLNHSLCLRRGLRSPMVTPPGANKKTNLLVDSALRKRIQMETVNRERPFPLASVPPIRKTPADSIIDDIPW